MLEKERETLLWQMLLIIVGFKRGNERCADGESEEWRKGVTLRLINEDSVAAPAISFLGLEFASSFTIFQYVFMGWDFGLFEMNYFPKG